MTTVRTTRHDPWRIARWTIAAALLALPAAAMRFTTEVNWTGGDFVAAALLLGVPLLGYEVIARRGDPAVRAGAALALLAAFLLVWINLAVGIVGSEENAANLLYAAVLAVALGGAIVAGARPRRLARAMLATAATQVGVTGLAVAAGLGRGGPIWPWDAIGVTAGLTALWLAAAALFARAARA